VTVQDTVPPEITVPAGGVFADVQGPSGAMVDYLAGVSVSDSVDPAPALSCTPPSGGTFAVGTTVINCDATDSSGNTGSASFDVTVGYSGGVGITPTKLNVKSGSSNPLRWAWTNAAGNNVDSSADTQMLSIASCSTGAVILSAAGDPGSSGFRFKSDLSWEFNWQSDDVAGSPLPKGTYCATVRSALTGQELSSPPIRLR